MSILIRGMEMPQNCDKCRFQSKFRFCGAMPDNFCERTDDIEKPDWCPLVEVSEPSYTDEWCHDCSEYDNEHHCCHRWAHVIRKTVEELQLVHCKDCVCYDSDNEMCLDTIGFGRRWKEMDYCSYGRHDQPCGS